MLLGADFGYLMDSGLSFYLNNNVSFLSSGNMVTPSLDNFITSRIAKTKGAFYKGAFYDGQFLVGWTFKNLVPNLRISILGGLGFGYGTFTPTQLKIGGEKWIF